MAEHRIAVIKIVSTATYSASSPSHFSRQPWQLRNRDGGVGDLLWSTVNIHAVNVNNATITSHGCDAQNFPWARNNCDVIFSNYALNLVTGLKIINSSSCSSQCVVGKKLNAIDLLIFNITKCLHFNSTDARYKLLYQSGFEMPKPLNLYNSPE